MSAMTTMSLEGPAVGFGSGDMPATPGPASNTSLVDTGVGGMITRAAFLAFFIIVGFVGNCVLIATISQSNRLKSSVLNHIIISVAVANILDCIGNMPIILGATITEKWDYGSVVCHLNAFGLQLVSISVLMGLMLMTFDRFIGVLNPSKHAKRLTLTRVRILIVYGWLHSIAFSFPLVLDSVMPIKAYPARYLCAVTSGTSLLYLCLTTVFAYLIPVFLIIGFFIHIARIACRERMRAKRLKKNNTNGIANGQNTSVSETAQAQRKRLCAEIDASKYVGVLFVILVLVEGPYFVMTSLALYSQSEELSEYEDVQDALNFTYPWEVELAFTWMKLSYPLFLPFVTFFWKKEVWQKFKNLILCRKSNLIVDASPRRSPQHNGGGGAADGVANGSVHGVPVLFATEGGLHIGLYSKRTDRDDFSELDHPAGANRKRGSSKVLTTTTKCDVMGSQDFLQLDDDTSDYDSSGELDPFSNSNPISLRTEYARSKTVLDTKKSARPASGSSQSSHESDKESASGGAKCFRSSEEEEEEEEEEETDPPIGEQPNGHEDKKGLSKKSIENKTNHAGKKETHVSNGTSEHKDGDKDEEPAKTSNLNRKESHVRRSHDSGMGSLEDKKKKKRTQFAATNSDKNDAEVTEVQNDDVVVDTECTIAEKSPEAHNKAKTKTKLKKSDRSHKKQKKSKKKLELGDGEVIEMDVVVPKDNEGVQHRRALPNRVEPTSPGATSHDRCDSDTTGSGNKPSTLRDLSLQLQLDHQVDEEVVEVVVDKKNDLKVKHRKSSKYSRSVSQPEPVVAAGDSNFVDSGVKKWRAKECAASAPTTPQGVGHKTGGRPSRDSPAMDARDRENDHFKFASDVRSASAADLGRPSVVESDRDAYTDRPDSSSTTIESATPRTIPKPKKRKTKEAKPIPAPRDIRREPMRQIHVGAFETARDES